MAKPTRVYWDACTWIAYLNKEENIRLPDGSTENRFSMCLDVLDRAEKGEIEIATSAFTLAEVCKDIKIKTLENLSGFFDRSYIFMIPVDKSIGLKAQDMQVNGEINLKPPDAVHLASAYRSSAKELHTFDKRILGHNKKIAELWESRIKICKPGEGEPLPLFENDRKPAS